MQKSRKWGWMVPFGILLVTMFWLSGGCGPGGTTHDETISGGDGGGQIDQISTDTGGHTEVSPPQDRKFPQDTPNPRDTPIDDTSQQDQSPSDTTSPETPTIDTTPSDASVPDTPTTDTTSTPDLTTDGTTTDGTTSDGALPEPACGKLGEKIGPNGQCCAGLTAANDATPPGCTSTSPDQRCVNCGDGTCDAKHGENTCNCPADCKAPPQCQVDADCGNPTCTSTGPSGSDCEASTPACVAGSCVTSKKTNLNATCDANSGTCVPKPQCKNNADCGKPSCTHAGTNCIQTTPTCTAGNCTNTRTTVRNARCNTTTGRCVQNRCTKNLDCGKPSCQNIGNDCQTTTPKCTNGSCVKAISPVIKNAACDAATGTCKPRPQCQSPCDCAQGLDCVGGKCVVGIRAVFCCDNPGCPKGQQCIDKTGKRGVCGGGPCTSNADCGKLTCHVSGTSCIQSFPVCTAGACQSTSRTYANSACSSNGTCTPKTCKVKTDCNTKKTCRQSNETCIETSPICINGTCSSTSKNFLYLKCDTTTGTCKRPQCTSNADCGKPTCRQSGVSCYPNTPLCNRGACQAVTGKPLVYYTCNQNTGKCDPPKTCTSSSQCPGKPTCQQNGTYCYRTAPACISKRCTTTSTSLNNHTCHTATGACLPTKCTTNADCGKPTCSSSSQGCYQNTPTCTNGVCISQTTTIPGQSCDHTTGLCKPPTQCTSASQCGQSTCTETSSGINGTPYCTEYTPTCIHGICGQNPRSYINYTCNQTTGKCQPKTCRANTDCGKQTCRQNGTYCYQLLPTCTNGACQIVSHYLNNYTCNTTTGQCENKCTSNSDCGTNTCRNIGTDCVQFVPVCTNGACQSTSNTTKNASCNNTTGLCIPRATCQTNTDCGKPSCRQNGSYCHQTTPTCTNGACNTISQYITNSTCNTTTGLCKRPPSRCTSNTNCGKPFCRTIANNNCYQYTPTCTNNTCQTQNTYKYRHRCNTTTGFCQSIGCTRNNQCGYSSCQNVGLDCVLTLPQCTKKGCSTQTTTTKAAICTYNRTTHLHDCQKRKKCSKNKDCGTPTCRVTNGQCYQTTPTCTNGYCTTSNQYGPGTCSGGTCRFSSQP